MHKNTRPHPPLVFARWLGSWLRISCRGTCVLSGPAEKSTRSFIASCLLTSAAAAAAAAAAFRVDLDEDRAFLLRPDNPHDPSSTALSRGAKRIFSDRVLKKCLHVLTNPMLLGVGWGLRTRNIFQEETVRASALLILGATVRKRSTRAGGSS